jgi:hypothetical protein
MYVATYTKGIYYSANFTSSPPTWTKTVTGLSTDNINWFNADPLLPSNVQYCITHSNRGDETTKEMFSRTAAGSWTSILTNAQAKTAITAAGFTPHATINSPNVCITDIHRAGFIGTIISSDTKWFWLQSLDYGVTWTAISQISTTSFNARVLGANVGFFKGGSSYSAGKVCISIHYRTGVGGERHVAFSTDQAATWTDYETPTELPLNTSLAPQVDIFQDVSYLLCGQASTKGLWVSTNRGANWTNIWSDYGFGFGSIPSNGAMLCAPLYDPTISQTRAQTIRITGADLLANNVGNKDIWKTTNAGVTWTRYTFDATLPTCDFGIICLGDADGKLIGVALSAPATDNQTIWSSINEGVTWTARSGTDTSSGTTTGIPYNHGGIISALPVYA